MAVEEAIQEEFENNNNNHSAFHHQKQAFLPNTISPAETPSEQKLNQNNGPSSLVYSEPSAHSNPRWRPQLMQQPRGKNTWFDDKVREFLDSCELDTICQESNVYRVKSKVIFLVLSDTRVCGITGSASARRWGGYGFNSRPKPRHS